MSYTTFGDWISQPDAEILTAKFKTTHPNLTSSVTFSKELVDALLSNEQNVRLRVYFGQDEAGIVTALLTAVDGRNKDDLTAGILEFGNHSNPSPL